MQAVTPPEGIPETAWFDTLAYWYDDPSKTKYYYWDGAVQSVEPYDEYDLAQLAWRVSEIERLRPVYDGMIANEAAIDSNTQWLEDNPDAEPIQRALVEQSTRYAVILNLATAPMIDPETNARPWLRF